MAPKRIKFAPVATIFVLGLLAAWCAPRFARADGTAAPTIWGQAVATPQGQAAVAAQGQTVAPPTTDQPNAAPTETVACDVPSYSDHGIVMAPLRPVCQFLGLSLDYTGGVVTLQSKQTPGCSMSFRVGGPTAQIVNAAQKKSARFPRPAEERLGNMFVPLKFTVAAFGADADGTTILAGNRRGALNFQAAPPPPDNAAASLSVFNYTHRALSLHLDGPQKIILELGSGESVLLKVRPGRYNYWAESMGSPVHSGTRSFSIDPKSTWIWGGS